MGETKTREKKEREKEEGEKEAESIRTYEVPEREMLEWGRSLSYWCFKPTQPQRIISGLRKTFIKRHIVERTNKAEKRSEEESGKPESF